MEVVPGKGKFNFRLGHTRIARGVLIPTWHSHPDTHGDASWPVDVPVNGDFTADKIVVSRGLVVSGVVRDANEKPVVGVKVTAQARDRLTPTRGYATTDADGKYEIAGLNPKNSYEIRVANESESTMVLTDRFDDHPVNESKL